MKVYTLSLLALLIASPLAAQTPHPCDVTPEVNPSTARTIHVGWCHPRTDMNGDQIILTKFTIRIDGTTTPLYVWTSSLPAGIQPTLDTPNSDGLWWYELPQALSVQRGTHTATVTVTDDEGQESSQSVPYGFTAKNGKPKEPTNGRTR